MGRFRGRVIRLPCCVMLPPAVKRQSKCVRVKHESAIEMLLRLFEICHIWNISRNSYCVKTIRCDDSCNWIFIFNSSMCPTHTPGHQQRVFTDAKGLREWTRVWARSRGQEEPRWESDALLMNGAWPTGGWILMINVSWALATGRGGVFLLKGFVSSARVSRCL